MQTTPRVVTEYGQVRAVLDDPAFAVPPVPDADYPGRIGWLRANVARFSSGSAHRHLRDLAVGELAGMSATALRRQAAARASAALGTRAGPVDVMAELARVVPAEVLLDELGMTGAVAADVIAVGRAYPPSAEADAAADRACVRLVRAAGGTADQRTATRIGLLAQACDATAGLVGNALLARSRYEPEVPVQAIVSETLRHDPPVLRTRRQAVAPATVGRAEVPAGAGVTLDLAAANRDGTVFTDPDRFDPGRAGPTHLTFGAGAHACPGGDHAVALATGILESLRGYRLVTTEVEYEPSNTLRIPVSVVVTRR